MKTIKSKMYRLGHKCRGIINEGSWKIIKIKGRVVKKPISCRYAFPTIPLYKATSAAADMILNRALEDTDADTEKAPGLKEKFIADEQ